jgi:16S rRNA (cytidine1402-2'-O)-methyltransferase
MHDMQSTTGTLYIVPTPIGNLEDMTFRAVRILKEVDIVLCENTSVTQRLFKEYGITTKTTVFYANSSIKNIEGILAILQDGKKVALVSDAGTPTISDPGVLLVDTLRNEFPQVAIIGLPGASALTTALSVSGISSAKFTFFGFVRHKKGRETLFATVAASKETSVFYESVHRIEKTLESLVLVLDSSRVVSVVRELTKLHEEVVRGSAVEVKEYFLTHKEKVRGEFVVIIDGKK